MAEFWNPTGQNGQNSKVVPHDQRSAGLGVIKPSFKCKKPGHSHSVTVTVDLSSVHVTHKYDRHHPTNLKLDISGSPKFTLSFDFKGNVECTAKALATVPLGDTGLELKIGPKLKFDADGELGADFTWQPSIEFGFTLNRHGFTHVVRSLKNGTGIDFTSNGSASLSLGVDTVVETDGGVAGLEGVVGPVLTANVTADSATGATCWSGALSGEADFTAFVRVFHNLQAKADYDKKFGHRKRQCCVGLSLSEPPPVWWTPDLPGCAWRRESRWDSNAGSSRRNSRLMRSRWCGRRAGRSLRSPMSWASASPTSATG